jgi:shikimate kinase
MQVFLIGFMGAGKSSLANRLSSRLEIPFVDMDQDIENQQGKSIHAIFEQSGEEHFRTLEKQWIHQLSSDNKLIALGGGAACSDEIMDILRKKGVPVYLKVSDGILTSRLMNSKTNRPVIEPFKEDKNKMLDFVKMKLKEREKFYLKSKIIFESSDIKAEGLDLLADLILLSKS